MSQLTQQIHSSEIGDILENSLNGIRPKKEDYLRLLKSDDVYLMGLVAGNITRKKFGKKVTFVNNNILNYTNVCITDCKFCAFYRPPNHEEAYTLTLDEIEARVKTGWDMFKIRQVLIQGGHNPKLGIEYYEDSFKMIRSKFPNVGVHGLSTSEIDMIATVEKSSTKEILSRLKDAGLQSVPGAGAEILTDSVKEIISPKKIDSDDWIRIMKESFELGLPASATMMYGHVETDNDIVGLRVGIKTAGCSGLKYNIEYAKEVKPFEEKVLVDDVLILIDPAATMFLIGSKMDYKESKFSSGFEFENPNEISRCGCGESFTV